MKFWRDRRGWAVYQKF